MALYYRGKDYDNGDAARAYDRKLLAILWTFAAPFTKMLALAFAIMLLAAAADLARPYLLKLAIDRYVASGDVPGLRAIVYSYAGTIALSAVLSYAETLLLQYIGQNIMFTIRAKVFRQLMYQRYQELESQPVGRMVTRVTNDTDAVKELYTDVLVAFASDLIILGGIIAVMLWLDWRMALVAFTVIPVMIALAALYQKFARQAYRMVREKTAAINTFLQEHINSISVIKAFFRFAEVKAEYATISKEYLAAGLREMRIFAFFRPFVDLIYVLATILVLGFGGWQYQQGTVEVGLVVAFLRYVEKFFWPIKDLAEKYNLLQAALAAAERIYDLIYSGQTAETDDSDDDSDEEKPLKPFEGSIRFERVWFAYEGENWVLKDVTFEWKAGEFIGIAGPSGSGKTTLIGLLLRFYEPQRGAIYLDGRDIRHIPLRELRRQIGVVFQDVHLFKGTIRDNITLYNRSITEDTVKRAAEMTDIAGFIETLPQQYDTQVGYHGALISAGQRQLISLARALALNTPILALDEATSSIDSATEAHIQRALGRIAKVKTMLVVAHRLSTIQAADKIIVFSRGRIVQQGTHQQLINQDGLYRRLFNSQ